MAVIRDRTQLTDHEKIKIQRQIKGIQNTIIFLKWHREQLKQMILQQIPMQSRLIQIPEKEIKISWGQIPIDYVKAIKECKLDRKIYVMHNIYFQMNLVLAREIGHHISDLYNSINHIFNLIVFAHPSKIVKNTISDDLKSLLANQDLLYRKIPTILLNAKKWIREFKEIRKIDEHKSPNDFCIVFNVDENKSMAKFSLLNPYTSNETDLFQILNYLEKVEEFFNLIRIEIEQLV